MFGRRGVRPCGRPLEGNPVAVVYDFSGSDTRPAAQLTDLPGAVGAMLYMGTPGRRKNATPTQVAALLAGGYEVGGVFEDGLYDWSAGRAGGQQFARLFDADATRCGVPGLAGAFTADMPAAVPARFVEVLAGACDVLTVERVTAYGYMPHLLAARDAGVASRFWLTGHCPQPMPDWVNLYQHNGSQPAAWGPTQTIVGGIQVDHNTVCRDDWGQFNYRGADVTPEEHEWLRQMYVSMSQPYEKTKVDVGQVFVGLVGAGVKLDKLLAGQGGDPAALADHLAPLLLAGGLVTHLSDADAAQLAVIVNNELDRRAAARATTPVAAK